MFATMTDSNDNPKDPFRNFPGGNPFGPQGPFGPGGPFAGGPGGPLGSSGMDEWLRNMGIDPSEFQKLFDEMQRNLQEAFKNMGQDPSKGFVAGFNVRMGPDGKPHFSSFGNKPAVRREAGSAVPSVVSDDREPLTDVIEDPTQVAITMELPGVDKRDINVHMTDDVLEISVDTELRKYHKRVRLPTKVDPSTTKATYTNGILDVTVQKQVQDQAGVRIEID